VGDASFADEGILDETVAEAGIGWEAEVGLAWTFAAKSPIAAGIVKFAQAFAGGAVAGLGKLQALLGGGATIRLQQNVPDICNAGVPCAVDSTPPYVVSWPSAFLRESPLRVGVTVVHELAHVIDWASGATFSADWYSSHSLPRDGLTAYAQCRLGDCVPSWERWAEAVATWVYDGPRYAYELTPLGPADPRPNLRTVATQTADIAGLLNPR
jgi:hypothetical protein